MLKFGLDVGGVLRDIAGKIIEVYNLKFAKNMKFEDFIHYDINLQFPEIINASKYFLSGDVGKLILQNSLPIDGSLESYRILSEIGIVYIVSSQNGYDNINYTINWLYNNGFNTDQLCFVHDKSVLSGLDYLIDDNPIKFSGCKCKNKILIDMPYNRYDLSTVLSFADIENMKRYKNLENFTKTLIK